MANNLPQKELREKQSPKGNLTTGIARALKIHKLKKDAVKAEDKAEYLNLPYVIAGKTIGGLPAAAKKVGKKILTSTGWMRKK